jgi:hypothetical protein
MVYRTEILAGSRTNHLASDREFWIMSRTITTIVSSLFGIGPGGLHQHLVAPG